MNGVSYSDLDPALCAWADRHGLHVFTRNRDYETRAVLIVDDTGDTYSLVAAPTDAGLVSIGAAIQNRFTRLVTPEERKSLCYHEKIPLAELEAALERGYAEVESWIRSEGHTRTPV